MNPSEVQTILINLLRNAFDAVSDSRVNRFVQLKIFEEKEKIIFEIADFGGNLHFNISQHIFPHILQPNRWVWVWVFFGFSKLLLKETVAL